MTTDLEPNKQFVLDRLPADPDELYHLVTSLWGVVIPRHKVCPDHVAPFDVFADAYFNVGESITLWHGSRGLSGKSFMLSILGLTKAFLRGTDVNLLGGSLAQSTNIHEHMRSAMDSNYSPRYMIETESQTMIKLTNGARIRPLTASQKTVRGPHPPFLLCLAGWSQIETTEGNKRLDEITPGQIVRVSDDMATSRWGIVSRVIDMGYKETITLELSNDTELTCTPDHEIATERGWVQAQDLTTSDVLIVRDQDSRQWQAQDINVSELLGKRAAPPQDQILVPSVWGRGNNLQGHQMSELLRPSTAGQSEFLSRLQSTTKTNNYQKMPPLPFEVDEQRKGDSQVLRGQSNSQRRDKILQGRGQSSSITTDVWDQLSTSGSLWQMGHRFLSTGLQRLYRGTWWVLARCGAQPTKRKAGSKEERGINSQRSHSLVLENRRRVPMDEVRVRAVRNSPAIRVWDLTTDTGNFYADGALVHNCDEIDEMDLPILDAALGQPMPQKNYLGEIVKPYTVLCSTWQNPEGCVVINTPITTKRGQIPIEDVKIGDYVPTRNGWRSVTNVINTGMQRCVTVELKSGKSLVCTGWHPIWTDTGWVDAEALTVGSLVSTVVLGMSLTPLSTPDIATDPALATAIDSRTIEGEVMPVLTDALVGASPVIVDSSGDGLKVSDVDTGSSATSVIEGKIIGDHTKDFEPDPSMGQEYTLTCDEVPVGLVSVPVLTDSEGPEDAVVGVEGDLYTFTYDEVVNVVHNDIVLPTWDLTVDDTHEYVANGLLVHNTFTEMKRRFEERGLPIKTWCYKDSANPIDGWLTQETIENKKREINAEMWRVEYMLGEPSIGNRAFDPESIEKTFSLEFSPIFTKQQKDYEEYRFEEFNKHGRYVAGADWGKEQDYTVISVVRTDVHPSRLVYFLKCNRRPYPIMVGYFNKAIGEYNAQGLHDRTGLGNVVNDYLDTRANGFTMTGEKRDAMLSEYVSGVEKGDLAYPKIPSSYISHKYTRVGDLYSRTQEYHLPDDVCAMALAYRASRKYGTAVTIQGVRKTKEKNKYEKMFAVQQEPTVVSAESAGEVRRVSTNPDDEYTLTL